MIPHRWRELLSGYVDGELTQRQHRLVERVLEQSAEARELLRRLEADAAALRRLTPPVLDRDLSSAVLNAIRERGLRPRRHRVFRSQPALLSSGAVLAGAAAVLLLVGMSSYLLLRISEPGPVGRQVQPEGQGRAVAERHPVEPPPAVEPAAPAPAATPLAQQATPVPVRRSGDGTAFVGPPPAGEEKEKLPEEPRAESAVVTARSMELFQPERVEAVALPVVLALRDLEGDEGRDKLLRELRKESAFRIELPCRNATRAFERVQVALRSQDVVAVVEQTAMMRLGQPQWRTNYVLFAEDLTPEELATVLRDCGRIDRDGKPAEAQLADVVVTRLSKGHRKDLSDLLGVDPVPIPPEATGPLGTDPHKPLPELTAGQVADALSEKTGQGTDSRGVTAKPPRRQALVLAFYPVRPPRGSPDVRHFLDGRKPARTGTVQVLLVIRGS
jgi:anti-sigma factor RsiW